MSSFNNNKEVDNCRQTTSVRIKSPCIDLSMATTAQAVPSQEARSLFNNMVALAQPLGEDSNTLHISVGNTLVIGCQRARSGLNASATAEIQELTGEQWIAPAPGGGWYLG